MPTSAQPRLCRHRDYADVGSSSHSYLPTLVGIISRSSANAAASNCDGFTGMRSMILTDKIVGGRNPRAKRAAALGRNGQDYADLLGVP